WHIPLPAKEGCLRHEKMLRSHRKGADGVVAHRYVACDRPPRPLLSKVALQHCLRSRPPLLCKEGNVEFAGRSFSPIPEFPELRRNPHHSPLPWRATTTDLVSM